MEHIVRVTMTMTVWCWIAAEVLLQLMQLRRSGPTKQSEWRSLVVIAVLVTAGIDLRGPLTHALPSLSYSTGRPAIGTVMLVVAWAGLGLRLWAIVALGKFFRGTVHIQQDHQVVRSGPYRWVRHPAYSGMLLAAAGLAVSLDNAAAWAACMAGCAIGLGYRIRVEERMLTQSLGEPYAAYAARTRRLIPGVW